MPKRPSILPIFFFKKLIYDWIRRFLEIIKDAERISGYNDFIDPKTWK